MVRRKGDRAQAPPAVNPMPHARLAAFALAVPLLALVPPSAPELSPRLVGDLPYVVDEDGDSMSGNLVFLGNATGIGLAGSVLRGGPLQYGGTSVCLANGAGCPPPPPGPRTAGALLTTPTNLGVCKALLSITIVAPQPGGSIVVDFDIVSRISDSDALVAQARYTVETTPGNATSGCSTSAIPYGDHQVVFVGSQQPYFENLHKTRRFTNVGVGAHTFYLNGLGVTPASPSAMMAQNGALTAAWFPL